MISLSKVKYSEFSDLVNFLSEDNESYMIERLGRFFPNLTSVQLFDLHFICSLIIKKDEHAEEIYNNFISENPDIEMDETGKSEPLSNASSFWEVTLKSLDSIFSISEASLKNNEYIDKSEHKTDSQVYNAKKLSCLINRVPTGTYSINKAMFLKKSQNDIINKNSLEAAERVLTTFGLDSDCIMNKFLDLVSKRQYSNYRTFASHFFERLRCLSFEKPNDIKNASNSDFFMSLKAIK